MERGWCSVCVAIVFCDLFLFNIDPGIENGGGSGGGHYACVCVRLFALTAFVKKRDNF